MKDVKRVRTYSQRLTDVVRLNGTYKQERKLAKRKVAKTHIF
jgi:hypothetical protein